MGAADQIGPVGRGEIQQPPESSLAAPELPCRGELRIADFWIDEELDRIITRLAVNIDGARIIGSASLVQPPIIAEPAIGLCDRDQLARALMIEAMRALLLLAPDGFDAIQPSDQGAHLRDPRRIAHINMCDLMI